MFLSSSCLLRSYACVPVGMGAECTGILYVVATGSLSNLMRRDLRPSNEYARNTQSKQREIYLPDQIVLVFQQWCIVPEPKQVEFVASCVHSSLKRW